MRRFNVAAAFAVVALAGCGAEVAGTAATAGKVQGAAAEQAQARQAQIKDQLAAAMQAAASAASSAEGQ